MVKKTFILRVLVLAIVAFTLSCVCLAKELVSIPNFSVRINDKAVNSTYREYPLVTYKGITYFPMTYNDARFLGLKTEWNGNTNTLTIDKEYDPSAAYYATSRRTQNPAYDYATISTCNIVINGKRIINSREEYPIINYRNITYFPLTWRFAVEEFGWSYAFDNQNGLRIRNDGESLDTPYYPDELLRPVYNVGNCKDITAPTTVMVVFVDDDESKWTKQEADVFFNTLQKADAFLDKQFARYGKTFDLAYSYYGVDVSSAKFNGKVKDGTAAIDYNIMDVMSKSLGFKTMNEMDGFLKNHFGREQVLYIYAVNKIGRSYAINDSIKNGVDDGVDTFECNVIFNVSWEDKVSKIIPATIAHEMLHLFGAEDFYGNAGSFRKQYFDNNHPNEIMRTLYNDISYNTLSDITAFNVGLTDTVPDVLLDPAWRS